MFPDPIKVITRRTAHRGLRSCTHAMVASSVGLISLCFAASASAGALELTSENFDREVFDSGKNAFIKFLAVRRARPPP